MSLALLLSASRLLPSAAGVLTFFMFQLPVCAAVEEGATTVEFSGTVVAPPDCVFNNGRLIEVPFGYVGVGKADGRQIVKTVEHQLVCRGKDANKMLKMKLTGTPGPTDDVLATSIDGLGIRFYQNGNSVTLDKWFSLPTPADGLVLTASPILAAAAKPETGNFEATATLMVTIQ